MELLIKFLPTLQVIISVLLIIFILIQQSDESLGGAFGGSDSTLGAPKKTRRGAEKFVFKSTISLSVLFVLISILSLILK